MKALVWDLEIPNARLHCWTLLGQLTGVARTDEVFDILSEFWPIILSCTAPKGLLLAWMVSMVEEVEDQVPHGHWNHWTWIVDVRDLA